MSFASRMGYRQGVPANRVVFAQLRGMIQAGRVGLEPTTDGL